MLDAEDDPLVGGVGVVERVGAVEGYAQAGREHLTSGANVRGMLQRLEFLFDGVEKSCGRGF
jgi:hypothetical protein